MAATPTVYFIDDSATMREVIKIAFRRENINVVAYNDAQSALSQIESNRPDVVITDVIMPDRDGYEVCQFIKQHAQLNGIPVILMSGVVNKAVADKAFSVKADELIRKPFQPQDLITRVRHLLGTPVAVAPPPQVAANAAATLTSIFQAQPQAMPKSRVPQAPASTFAAAATPASPAVPASVGGTHMAPAPSTPAVAPMPAIPHRPNPVSATAVSPELSKIKLEILRLEGLVKKLQSELSAEREYSKALEEHVKTLQETD
jgi:CheY-like chemotaxis protein